MKTGLKRSSSLLKSFTLALLSAVGISIALTWTTQPASAQLTSSDGLNDNPQSGDGSSDPFSSNGSGQVNGMFDLIHRAQFGSLRSVSEFQQEQQTTITSEAENFRALQLQLLQQAESNAVTTETPSPAETPTESN